MYDACTCTEGLLYSGSLVVLANFECHLAVTVVFMWQLRLRNHCVVVENCNFIMRIFDFACLVAVL